MLVYVAQLHRCRWLVHGPWRDPEGFNFPQSQDVRRRRAAADPARGDAAQRRLPDRARRPSPSGWVFMTPQLRRLPDARGGPGAARPPLRRLLGQAHRLDRHADRRRLRRASPASARSPARSGQLLPHDLARLRLRRDHRRLRRPPAPARHPVRQPADVAALPRRRVGADGPRRCRRRSPALFQGMLLFFLLAADVFIHYRLRFARAAAGAGAHDGRSLFDLDPGR